MDSLILRVASCWIVPLQLLLSVLIMLRGHNEAGGGFVGGLVAAASVVLWGVAYGMDNARRLIPFPTQYFMAAGLSCAALSGVLALFLNRPYMTALWGGAIETLVVGKLKFGTPVLFDFGVYLVVIGVVLTIIFSLSDEGERKTGTQRCQDTREKTK